VTDRHLAEESLRIYRQHLESAVQARTGQLEAANRDLQETQFAMDRVGIGIYWVELASGRILDGNRQACELLGYTQEELLQLAVPDVAPEFPQARYAQMAGRIRQQGTARFETCHRRKDGSLLPVEVTAYYSELTQPARIIGFVTDISERKRTEAARETALLAAERLSRLKSEFINNMSHELRTPLNAVIGLASIGSHSRDLGKAQEICSRIHESGRKLLSLIEDVLDFSELETGRLQLAHENYSPVAVVEQAVAAFLPQAEARGLKLEVQGLEQLPEQASGDPRRLGQVLWQLLDNAVKFTEQGEIRLECNSDGRTLRWQLCDTGIGLSPEHLAGLFRPFEQGDGSMTRRFGGTGLGLALTQRLLQQMGGSIQVDSQLGQGTCVSVSLPLGA
jgi:PAS domain S-box-containing protein